MIENGRVYTPVYRLHGDLGKLISSLESVLKAQAEYAYFKAVAQTRGEEPHYCGSDRKLRVPQREQEGGDWRLGHGAHLTRERCHLLA